MAGRRKTVKKSNTGSGGSTRRKVVATSIPELKRSFDAIESAATEILRAPEAQRVRKFQDAWRRIFGRPVDATAAAAYLQIKARSVGRGVTRKQRGGAAAAPLAGAPVDYQTRPGVDGAHGQFLPYVARGLSFYNTVNQDGLATQCGKEDITPAVPADIGSNKFQKLEGGGQGGGGLGDWFHVITNKPFAEGAPPGIVNDAIRSWSGRELGASPAPEQNHLKLLG